MEVRPTESRVGNRFDKALAEYKADDLATNPLKEHTT